MNQIVDFRFTSNTSIRPGKGVRHTPFYNDGLRGMGSKAAKNRTWLLFQQNHRVKTAIRKPAFCTANRSDDSSNR